ncbi:group I intron-associated PD-(D/E)XK endonuclease [Bacillus cytotoxicus]|uniref:group I intron-associated PD-(D/E)XK endonuclease n=1 Tax=Bacillus cytotoxicus TaxID=580165 RepID=UPI000863CAB5|nr:group I intron-associated PD-(D/E)XK endonuclease [Bacillus cytotoxicus]AWC29103.1 hypothetical protein CG483_012700 [Bacillus cytotoxicus]AWC39511.1 hypothetical protein CG480_002550 [Bacillus cytotoxicus]AWC47442.1 hypothetical protein CG478_002550 [Bacillus cytotoxicus]AWC53174.1 hypothetical protein CG477_012660 [Bacillus cytotoxicus]AWC57303.1 hypothetical protein CG476_012685 [Bacillus cytotoxicus]
MAHETTVKGGCSELRVALALLNLGWEVAKPLIPEVYDLVARDPLNKQWYKIQVKTIRVRQDRDNALVVRATKGNDQAYTSEDCDYIAGVEGDRVFMFECAGQREYWATKTSASQRWIELTAVTNNEENEEEIKHG